MPEQWIAFIRGELCAEPLQAAPSDLICERGSREADL